MTIRSDPLGPPLSSYPVSDYTLPIPDRDTTVDTVRIEKLALKPISFTPPSSSSHGIPKDSNGGMPVTFDAAVQFAIDGRSWPLRLSYDVSYVAAYPCANGPHPLFFDYVFESVKVDEILTIKDWGGLNGNASSVGGAASSNGDRPSSLAAGVGPGPEEDATEEEEDENDREKVLVIEAFGVSDNEVLARAWCSHWGLGAIVADVDRTW